MTNKLRNTFSVYCLALTVFLTEIKPSLKKSFICAVQTGFDSKQLEITLFVKLK